MDRKESTIIRVRGTFFTNDSVSFNADLEVADIIVKGGLKVDGNLTSRRIDLDEDGDLEVDGAVNAYGDIKVNHGDILIQSDCECFSISAKGLVCIGGNCKCSSITAQDDVAIYGVFFGNIEDIIVPEGHHVYINGKQVK